MRCTQVCGLSDYAHNFLERNAKKHTPKRCECCDQVLPGEPEGIVSRVYDETNGVQCGMFEDGPVLHEYELTDGRVVREVVQNVVWSSGPCIFLCLQFEDGTRIGEYAPQAFEYC